MSGGGTGEGFLGRGVCTMYHTDPFSMYICHDA